LKAKSIHTIPNFITRALYPELFLLHHGLTSEMCTLGILRKEYIMTHMVKIYAAFQIPMTQKFVATIY